MDTYGALNNNKYLTMRVAQESNEVYSYQLKPSNSSSEISFHLEVDGIVNPRILGILGTLFYAKELLAREVGNQFVDIVEMNNMNGTKWDEVMKAMVQGFKQFGSLKCEAYKKLDENIGHSVISSLEALKKRVDELLSSSSTVEEDEAFLAAAGWDGFGGVGLSESGCKSCRWQIEEMSFNDYLAVLYRLSRKNVLQRAITQLSCLVAKRNSTISSTIQQSVNDTTNQVYSRGTPTFSTLV